MLSHGIRSQPRRLPRRISPRARRAHCFRRAGPRRLDRLRRARLGERNRLGGAGAGDGDGIGIPGWAAGGGGSRGVDVERGALLLVLQGAFEVLGAAFFVAAGVFLVFAALLDFAASLACGRVFAVLAQGFAELVVGFALLGGVFDGGVDVFAEGFAVIFEGFLVRFARFAVVGVRAGEGEVLRPELVAEFADGFAEVVFFVRVGAEAVDEGADFGEGGVVEVFGGYGVEGGG